MRISDWSSDVCSSDLHAQWQGQDRDQRRADVPKEQTADDRDNDELLDQLVGEILDGAIDQLRAVIDRHHLDPGRQALPEIGELVLDRCDGLTGILARAKDHAAAGDRDFAVPLSSSEERRDGKECVSTDRYRWGQQQKKKN